MQEVWSQVVVDPVTEKWYDIEDSDLISEWVTSTDNRSAHFTATLEISSFLETFQKI